MLRAEQTLHRKQGRRTVSVALTDQALGRTDLAGKAATALAPLANKAIATPGSRARKAMEKVTGIASQRVLPPYAKTRFSTWWKKRTARSEEQTSELQSLMRISDSVFCLKKK